MKFSFSNDFTNHLYHRSRCPKSGVMYAERHTNRQIILMIKIVEKSHLLWFQSSKAKVNDKKEKNYINYQLGSVAGPVIQATGRLEFEDALWLSSPLYGLWAPSGCPQPNKKCGREWSNQSGSGPAAKNRTEIMPTMQTKFFLLNFQNNIGTFSI